MVERPKILLVEDNKVTSQTLVLFLSAENYDTTCAFDGREALNLFANNAFDLVMLDLMLPDVDGLQVCSQIRSKSKIPIIMLTAKSTEDEIVAGLEQGADDYVCKPFGSKELLARVRCCLRRKLNLKRASQVIQIGKVEVEIENRLVRVAGNSVKLTKSEFELLAILIRQPGRVFTRSQLIEQALGQNFDGLDRTIDTHIWNLRKKLGEPRGNPEYILSEPGVGYRMSDRHAN